MRSFQGATRKSNAIPGSASAVHSRKKLNQPVWSTIQPVVAFTTVRGTADRLVNSANCVAVNRGLVARAMNATYATVPSPTPSASNAITTPSATMSGLPSHASHAKPRIETTCTIPNSHSPRLMPIFTIHKPPRNPPNTLAHSPAFLATTPISVLEKPMSR